MALTETAQLVAHLTLKDSFSGPLKNAQRSLSGFDAKLSNTSTRAFRAGQQIGNGIRNLAKIALVAGSTAVLGIAAIAVRSLRVAGDFEAQLKTINTVARATPQGLKQIGDGIRQIARDTGTSTTDLTTAYYDLVSAGIKTADAQGVLTNANKLAIGGLATTAQTVDLLTTAINTYGGDASKAGEYTDIFAKAVERGKVTAAGIAESFSIIGPLASASGVSVGEIGAAFARLTASGVPAAEVATQMRSALVALAKPTDDLKALEKATGKSYLAIAGKKGLVAALEQMRIDGAKAGVPMIDLFGRIEGVNFALATTGPNFAAYNADLTAMGKASGTAAAQMAERQQGLNFQLARLKALASDAGITIGSALLPKITPLLARLNEFVNLNQGEIAAFGDTLAGLFSDTNINEGVNTLKGMFKTAQEVAPSLAAAAQITGRVVKEAVNLFKSLPPGLQTALVGGLALNKLTGGLVTNVAGGAVDLIGKALGNFAQRGSSPANPVFVSAIGGGLGGLPGVGGAAAAAGGGALATGLALTTAVLAPAAVGAAAFIIQGEIDKQSNDLNAQTRTFAGQATNAELANSVKGVEEQLGGMQFNTFDSKNKVVQVLNILKAEQNLRTPAPFAARGLPGQHGGLSTAMGGSAALIGGAVGSSVRKSLKPPLDRAARLAAVAAAHARSTVAAIRRMDTNPTVKVAVTTGATYINGRLFQAAVSRNATVVGGRGFQTRT